LFVLFIDILLDILEALNSGEAPDLDIEDVEGKKSTENDIEPQKDIDNKDGDKIEKPNSIGADSEDDKKKGKNKENTGDLPSNEGDDDLRNNVNDENSDKDKDSNDDDDDEDEVYIAELENRMQVLLRSSKGASPSEKRRILMEYNAHSDMIKNIKNDRK
jgi:hypothetical protein